MLSNFDLLSTSFYVRVHVWGRDGLSAAVKCERVGRLAWLRLDADSDSRCCLGKLASPRQPPTLCLLGPLYSSPLPTPTSLPGFLLVLVGKRPSWLVELDKPVRRSQFYSSVLLATPTWVVIFSPCTNLLLFFAPPPPECHACYHRSCFRPDRSCPRCQRLAARRERMARRNMEEAEDEGGAT